MIGIVMGKDKNLKTIIIDYTKGFELPEDRSIINNWDDYQECEINPAKKLIRKQKLFLDSKRFFLLDSGPRSVYLDQDKLENKIGKNALLLDYGVCHYLFDNPSKIPPMLKQKGKVAFFGTVLGWKHPYTGYILEHVVTEVPVLNIDNSGIKIELVSLFENKWNLQKIPIVAYRK